MAKRVLCSEPVMQNADKEKNSVAPKALGIEVFFPLLWGFFFFLARGRENNKCGGRNERNWQIRVRKYGMQNKVLGMKYLRMKEEINKGKRALKKYTAGAILEEGETRVL